jgi:L-alanine-DL-glutamate epimerase-like enolase superfamily enzyme
LSAPVCGRFLDDERHLPDPVRREAITAIALLGYRARYCAFLALSYPEPWRIVSPLTDRFVHCTTTPGWLGYSDDKLDRLAREAVEHGFTLIKLKVGANVADDVHRMKVAERGRYRAPLSGQSR